MARLEKTVFISYRRTDVYTALAVYQDLTAKGYDVFFDYTSIPSGDFEQIIIGNIKARAHFLLILTPTALDRCSEPGDWLRREIETAMDEQRNIIPLFFKGFNFGTPAVSEKLTGKLQDLNRYNGLNVHEDYFHAAMDRLSDQFLDVPLDMVLHPVSTEIQKAVQVEQGAANDALKKHNNFLGSVDGNKKIKLRSYGILAVIIFVIVFGFVLINNASNNKNAVTVTETDQVIQDRNNASSSSTSLENSTSTPTKTFTPTKEPTKTITPTPTLGVGSTIILPKDGMKMLYVPAGEFIMGLDGDENDNSAHIVDLDAFWIDKTEVTNSMYAICVDNGSCNQPKSLGSRTRSSYFNNADYSDYPVVNVNWDDAKSYCEWASRRLPSEAEWEKAARGLDSFIYPWGTDNITIDLANYGGLIGDTTAVNDFSEGASPYGVLNMAGNVWEWVADFYNSAYYSNSRSSNPTGPLTGENRVMRGGSYTDFVSTIRTIHRYGNYPLDTTSFIGFRCAMDAE